jgi:hypothetical protein
LDREFQVHESQQVETGLDYWIENSLGRRNSRGGDRAGVLGREFKLEETAKSRDWSGYWIEKILGRGNCEGEIGL